MSITITTIAACETAIGLALCVVYFHLRWVYHEAVKHPQR